MSEQLCPNCQKKPQPPMLHRGQCQVHFSPDCKAWTADFAFTMCDPCGEALERCVWCLGPISGGGGAEPPTNKQFVRQYSRDNGNHITGMNVGEQVLVELQVDLWSYLSWIPNMRESSPEVSYHGYRLVRDPQDWRHATIELYFDLNKVAENARIVVEEGVQTHADRWWWWTPPAPKNPKKWQCTVEIRR